MTLQDRDDVQASFDYQVLRAAIAMILETPKPLN